MFSTVSTIGFSFGLTNFVVALFISHEGFDSAWQWMALALVSGLARASVLWLQELLSARAAIKVKSQLRDKFYDGLEKLGARFIASRESARLNLLATTSLDALDAYFAKYLPQLFYTAIISPVLIVVIFASDSTSGWSLLFTLPLVPMFMVLIGLATSRAQEEQLESLSRMSQHLLEVLRGLVTLRIFGRAEKQVGTIEAVAHEHQKRTMKVLRISFLSGFALELIASLSVALIAVSIGLRLVDGSLSLQIGLFVLLLAPEAYLPLRMVGANFHAASDGIAASGQLFDILDEAESVTLNDSRLTNTFNGPKGALPRPKKITLITGPSGAGKSTLLKNLVNELGFENVAWMPQSTHMFTGSVAENIGGPNVDAHPKWLLQAMLLAGLEDVEETYQLSSSAPEISGGQAQRIALARAFYRALSHPQVKTMLLDEPISALDDRHSKIIAASLKKFANDGYALVVVSHQKLAFSDVQVKLPARQQEIQVSNG